MSTLKKIFFGNKCYMYSIMQKKIVYLRDKY